MDVTTSPEQSVDVLLIGAGIMSATLGTMLQEIDPSLQIALYEREATAGAESSDPWNNAGTGHASLCELNYAPMAQDGTVSAAKAVGVNEQFHVSRQFWSSLVESGRLKDPRNFINSLAHMSFVWGEKNSQYLAARHEAFRKEALFSQMHFSQDPAQIAEWAPLLMASRDSSEPLAASWTRDGTDVDFGSLTRQLVSTMADAGAEVRFNTEVGGLHQESDGSWTVNLRDRNVGEPRKVRARFVFIGAGGGALHLLQKSGIPEGRGFAGFPVSGQFLRCTDESIVDQHHAKVYGLAALGAPPMSAPHLDTRFVDGRRSLLFGPYAGFSTKFLKRGSFLDLPASLRIHNIVPMLAVGKDNLGLTKFLISEVLKPRGAKDALLSDFAPSLDGSSWELLTAGQRVQVIKKDAARGGVLQFGTELITSSDGTVAALLGASPGASTAAPIMIELIKRVFKDRLDRYEPKLRDLVPSYGHRLNENPSLLEEVTQSTVRSLQLDLS